MFRDGADLMAIVPIGASTGPIALTYTDGITTTSLTDFVVQGGLANPMIRSIFPTAGRPGSLVQLDGSGFTGVESVSFNGIPANFLIQGDTNIIATVPNNAVDGPIFVQRMNQLAQSPVPFDVTSSILSITGFTPTSGGNGTQVTLTGTGFFGVDTVQFNGASAYFFVPNDGTIQTFVPGGASSGPITIRKGSTQASSGTSFMVPGGVILPPPPTGGTGLAPTITSIQPTFSFPGGTVRVNGTNLGTTTRVKVGAFQVGFQVLSNTALDVFLPDFSGSGRLNIATSSGVVNSTTLITFL